MQKARPIQAEFIEFTCSECNQGVYRVSDQVIRSNPRQWLHRCSHCKHEVHLTLAYPVIRYKGRDFMVADWLRFGEMEKPYR